MKRLLLLFGLLLHQPFSFGQSHTVDSLQQLLKYEKSDRKKVDILKALCYEYEDSKPDSLLLLAQQGYFLSKNVRYVKGESDALGQMAAAYKNLGNFPKSLEYYLTKLKIEETSGSPSSLTVTYLSLASLYDESKDLDKGLLYAKKADLLINKFKLGVYAPYSLLDMGDIFEKKNMLDSAILYTRKCLNISMQSGNRLLIGTALNNLGNIYSKTGDFAQALENYYAGIPIEKTSNNYSTYVESTLGLAKIFAQTDRADSAFWYAKQSFTIATNNWFTSRALNASIFLSKAYKKSKSLDSAFAYQEIASVLRDSVESSEKVRELQNITSAEQLRQAELEQQRLLEIKEREQKLQLLFVGIMIPIFFFLSIFISRRKVHKKLIEFSGIVSVLLFFEYITLLLHPFIAEQTHHTPVFEIIILVCIAAIISPAHHKIQHWLLKKLAEYNYLKHHQPVVIPANNITEEDPGEGMQSPVI